MSSRYCMASPFGLSRATCAATTMTFGRAAFRQEGKYSASRLQCPRPAARSVLSSPAVGDSVTQRHTTLAGAVGLFGLFAGLCAIFALVVTVFEWRVERTPTNLAFAGVAAIACVMLLALARFLAARTRVFGALLITCFAVTFDWVAFGPGERHFSGGFSLGGVGIVARPGELLGRAMFGLGAVIFDVVAVVLW